MTTVQLVITLFFNQPRFEAVVSELILVKNEALYAINNLKKWMQPQHVERNLVRLLPSFFPICLPNIGIMNDLHNLFGENILSHFYKEMIVLFFCGRQSRLKLKLP